MPDFQRLTKLFVKHALAHLEGVSEAEIDPYKVVRRSIDDVKNCFAEDPDVGRKTILRIVDELTVGLLGSVLAAFTDICSRRNLSALDSLRDQGAPLLRKSPRHSLVIVHQGSRHHT
jgi:hypothetical protein